HFHPVGSDTPAARAAAEYCRPSAISTQNRRRTSRRTGGDPSDPSFGRLAFPDLIRHRTSINSVLRRLLELGGDRRFRHGDDVYDAYAEPAGKVAASRIGLKRSPPA